VLPSFEVTSVKTGDLHGLITIRVSGLTYSAENSYVAELIQDAYHVSPWQMPTESGWLTQDRFDIEANKPSGSKIGVNRFED